MTSLSIQTLIEEFKSVVFEYHEMEYRDNSKLKAILQLSADQEFNSDIENIIHDA